LLPDCGDGAARPGADGAFNPMNGSTQGTAQGRRFHYLRRLRGDQALSDAGWKADTAKSRNRQAF